MRRQVGPSLFDDPEGERPKTVWELHQEECARTAREFPPPPPTLPENERRKVVGMGKALNAASTEWRYLADRWVKALPPGTRFTSEDLTDAVGLPEGKVGTNRNNAVGAVMAAYSRAALIRDSGAWVKSQRATNHAAKITIWERTHLPGD